MDISVDDETILIIRCVGLNVSAKTTFKNVGVLSNLFLRATGTKIATNEKRTVRLSQSAPFKLGGRPPNSDPTPFYTSETVEDVPDAAPSLVASVRCPPDLDCTIRLSVYYSSNLTGEKDVLLAGTSFNRKEVLRAIQLKGEFISDMISEYCPGSKAFVEVVSHFPNVLPDVGTVYPSRTPEAIKEAEENFLGFDITSRRYSGNPFKQRYVFYGEQDLYRPLVVAEESTWEPRYSALIPALFMENFTSALMRSLNAWNMRYELERKRQGRFRSLKEAIQHGWHAVNVTVLEARVGSTRAQKERLRLQQLQQEQALAIAAAAEENASAVGAGNRSSARFASSGNNRPLSLVRGAASADAGGGGGSGAPLPLYHVCIPIPSAEEGAGTAAPAWSPKIEVAEDYVRGSRKVLQDESAPCTFVEVSLHDRAQVFSMPLGRTNTEHYTLNPVYGTNVHQPHGRKGSLVPLATSDCVEILFSERTAHFYSYDTTDRDAVTRWFHQQRELSRASVAADAQGAAVDGAGGQGDQSAQRHLSATLQGALAPPSADCVTSFSAKEAHFYRFVSTCHEVTAVFDVCMEEPSTGQRRKVGTCSLPLHAGCKVDTWLPVRRDPGSDGALLEDVEVRVSVSVQSPFSYSNTGEGERSASADLGGDSSQRDYFSAKPSPASMPEVLTYQRSVQGGAENYGAAERVAEGVARARSTSADGGGQAGEGRGSSLSDEQLSDLADYRATLANAYEWMWYAGFNGQDPLVLDSVAAAKPSVVKNAAPTAAVQETVVNQAPFAAEKPAPVRSSSPVPSQTRSHPDLAGGPEEHVAEEGTGAGAEDFEEHFQSSRMSVFDHEGDGAFSPLSAVDVAQHLGGGADGGLLEPTAFDHFDSVGEALAGLSPPSPPPAHNSPSPGQDQPSTSSPSANIPSAPTREARRPSISGKGSYKRSRVDFPYPLEWMRAHMEAMQALAEELGSILPLLKKAHKEDKGFRASPFKKQAEWQALPVNLHYQLMAVRPFTKTNVPDVRTEVVHSITCGAMSPHMLGHKDGGLYHRESKLVAAKMELERAKAAYVLRVKQAGLRCISTSPSESFGVHKRLLDIGDRTLKFETMCLETCHRRAYAVSQALSIAVNSLLLKLGLVLQGGIPERVCEQWLTCGVLIVFEGLLSVVAHERSMLEDTISAVDSLRNFQVRLLPFPDEASPEAEGAGAKRTLSLELKGREVLVYVPRASLRRMPPCYQTAAYSGGAVLPFNPVLFTQGIDIQQTMVSTFGGDTSKGRTNNLHLQHDVNLKGLRDINAYCLKALPVSMEVGTIRATSKATVPPTASSGSPSAEVFSDGVSAEKKAAVQAQMATHSMVRPLQETILSSSLTLKNVDLLIEVERLVLMLGGCRVTFCKSGKDRTGMACTLEQSRQLGERYGCGMSLQRVLRDANLMRLHGTRLLIAEKNIGRKVYSINKLQAQFLPVMFRPPAAVCEDMMKKDNS